MNNNTYVLCYLRAMQNVFILIRYNVKDKLYIELLKIFYSYIDLIPYLGSLDIIKLKNLISSLTGINTGVKEYIIHELDLLSPVNNIEDIQYVISSIPILKKIFDNIKDLESGKQYDRLYDLTDAVHNYPEMLMKSKTWNPSDYLKVYIMPYRKRWDNNFFEEWKDSPV